jgi:hypothetical protein
MSPWWLVWAGFAAGVLTAAALAVTRAYGVSIFSPRTQLGCLLVDDPRLPMAETLGLLLHLALGSTIIPLLYSAAFPLLHGPGWGSGALLGAVQGGAVLATLRKLGQANRAVRAGRLPEPGRWGAGWGRHTAVVVVLSAVVYGAVLGAILRAAHQRADAKLAVATHMSPHLVAGAVHGPLQGEAPYSIQMFFKAGPSAV